VELPRRLGIRALAKYGNDEAKAKDFVAQLFKNVPVSTPVRAARR
jgi:ABC-type sulfate transport system substrate-binding protein